MHLLAALAVSITLAIPGRTNATPTVAADGEFVVVAWSATLPAGATDLFAAMSRDGARTFSTPVRINNVDGDARVNGEQPPRVALGHRAAGVPSITVVWTTKGSAGTVLKSARSVDGGRTFSPAAVVRESDAAGNRGWHNVAAAADGRVQLIWLDHREMADHAMGAAPKHEHGGAPKVDGTTMAQQSKLFIGALDGAVPPRPITGGVCYCCKTAITVGPDGAVYAAWRHVYPGNIRDIAFTVSRDGGRTFAPPVRVSADEWVLEGCPDDGPAIALDREQRIHIAWPTLVKDGKTGEPAIAIFYATSRDGRTFTARSRLPVHGMAHHPQIAIGANEVPVVAWDEGEAGQRRVVAASAPGYQRTMLADGERGVYPSLVLAGPQVVAAWVSSQADRTVIRVAPVLP